jgi:DNA-directed RNA polymerases I, II, and III subunit RPABC2
MSKFADKKTDVSDEEDDDYEEEDDDLPTKVAVSKKGKAKYEGDSDEDDDESKISEIEESDLDNEDDDDENEDMIDITSSNEIGEREQNPHSKFLMDLESDGEHDDSDDEMYLQKFDQQTRTQILSNYHPDLQMHNYDEVDALSRVVRDDTGCIIDPLHRTLPFLTKYEKARILGERAKQINSGAKPLVSVEPDMIDGYLIALAELEQKKIPFIIKRPLPNNGCEYWKLKDLAIL